MLAALAVGLNATLGGKSAPREKSGLVGYPAFLPKDTLHVRSDAVLVGTESRPALTSEGDTVNVITRRWSVDAIVTGPEVPGEGLPYQAPVTTCTWTVTMWNANAPVPISVADFDSIDVAGEVFHPYLVSGQPRPPRLLEPGRKVTFELRAGEPVGEGLMRWAPNGDHIVAEWDFIIEND